MGGFFGIGGNANEDRNRAEEGWNQEKNVFNYSLPLSKTLNAQGQSTVGSGLSGMDAVKSFFQQIYSGSRPAQLASVAGETNAINAQADAQRRQAAAMGTGRTGGTAALNQEAEANRMAQINNMIFGARPAAAQQAGQISTAEANVGLQQLSAGLRALGLSEEAIQHFIDSSLQSRKMETDISRQKTQDWLGLASRTAKAIGSVGMSEFAE